MGIVKEFFFIKILPSLPLRIPTLLPCENTRGAGAAPLLCITYISCVIYRIEMLYASSKI